MKNEPQVGLESHQDHAEEAERSWLDPGPETIAPGVHRVPLPLPMDALRAVNVYVLESDDGLVLIDGGWALEESRRVLAEALRVLGYRLSDIRQFLVTHLHRDHYTQAVALRDEVGSLVGLGIGEKPSLDVLQSRGPIAGIEEHGRLLREVGAGALAERFLRAAGQGDPSEHYSPPDIWLTEGTYALAGGQNLLAVPTPGHTQGHLVFADLESGLLFAGDHVLPHITPSIGFEALVPAFPLHDYLTSLRAVLELPDLRLLPAHGPATDSSHARARELISHHDNRLDECLTAVRSGASTAVEVAGEIGWTRRRRALDTLDDFNQMLAVVETHAHLQLLLTTDRLVLTGQDPWTYRVPDL